MNSIYTLTTDDLDLEKTTAWLRENPTHYVFIPEDKVYMRDTDCIERRLCFKSITGDVIAFRLISENRYKE